MLNVEAKDKRNLKSEVYESKVRFHTTAMITDKDFGEKKSNGILFTAPLFLVGAKISLKNVILATSLVNTCKSQTAITAETRNGVYTEIYNRKYILELQEAFDNLLNKLTNLKKQVESGKNTKYKVDDIEKVDQFLSEINEKIVGDAGAIANDIYEFDMFGTDLLATLDRISSNKVKTWALAFAGYDDCDMCGLVGDNRKRNPVDVFFGESVSTTNGSRLKTLIGTNSLDRLNNNFIDKLKSKDFSKKLRDSGTKHNFGYNYYLCYFVQALLQIVLIDNEKLLTHMDCVIIKSNWDNFLMELSDPFLQSVFDDYKPNEIENPECPYKFVDFMLNKLLGKDLFKKLEINEEGCKCYAKGSIDISESLSNADHANQIITMELDYTLDNLTYNNSLFIGQGDFVHVALHNAYKKMDDVLKQKLQLLAFELNTKKIKLNQSGYTTSDEYKFGRIQEIEQKHVNNPITGKKNETGEIENIKYKVPNDYDTDISAEDLMDLVLKVQAIEKDLNDKLNKAISCFNKDNTKNFLDILIEFQKIDIYLNDNQVESILKNKEIIKAMFDFISQQNCDLKYIGVYSWLINNHPKFIDSINIDFLKVDLLTADGVSRLFKRIEEREGYNFKTEDKAKLLLALWQKNTFNGELIGKINSDIIKEMFKQDKECTNQTIIKFLNKFDNKTIESLDLADDNLSKDALNEIFFNMYKILTKDQIESIDCSKLNNLSTKILFENRLAYISQKNVNTFSDIAFKELTLPRLVQLLKTNSDLDFSKHKNWLQSLYLSELYLQFENDKDNKPFVRFVAKHINIFSKDQILSLRKYVFENFKDKEGNIDNDAQSVLKRLSAIEEEGDLEKNIVKITGIIGTDDNVYLWQADAILVHIYQKSPDKLKELLSYLIKNNELFADHVNAIFYCILCEITDEDIEKCFSCYQQMYGKISADDKDKSQQLDKDGYQDCLSKIREMFKTVLKEDKDPKDANKGKNINYLCLAKLSWIVDEINKLQDLSDLLSDEQIKSIDISDINLALGDLYSLLDKFGNKMKYEQFYKLVSSFNNEKIELLNGDNIPGEADDQSSDFLAKIALISNFINEREKAFQDKYSDIDDKFTDAIHNFVPIINKIGAQIYRDNSEKQLEYHNNNVYNRELYEKSDNTENVHNDLKVGKDDKEILDKLGALNDELNYEMKELDGKVNKIEELDKIMAKIKEEIKTSKDKVVKIDQLNQIVEKINEWDKMVANTKELSEIATKVKKKAGKNVITIKEILANIKESNKDAVTIDELNEIVAKTKESCEYKSMIEDCGNKLSGIKQKMKKFDQLYYGRKNKFLKLKKNFFIALGHLDTGKVSILFRNMYLNYEKSCSDKKELDSKKLEDRLNNIYNDNQIFWKLDPIVIQVGDKENKYTFNKFFMDGFIKIQSGKKQDGTESNFSLRQKQSMGIINVVGKVDKIEEKIDKDKAEEKDEKDAKNIKVTKFEQYTPKYILENLPLVLEQFHCSDYQLENEMEKVNLFNLTLKFEQGNKKSLERFIDSKKLKLIENASGDNAEQRERNAEMNNENHRYFKAVQKFFCNNSDNIVENADLIFETENPNGNGKKMFGNAFRIQYAPFIQFEFHRELIILTRKEVEGKIVYLDKQDIIGNLVAMKKNDKRIYEHFLFFCGDWICHSSKFLSEDVSLENFKNIVKKRIEFGCRGQGQNKLELNKEIYNLLTAVTLMFGLESADGLSKMDKTVIDEICFLITGKRGNFVPDDLRLIRSVTKLFFYSYRYRAWLILEHVIKNQDYKHVFTCLNMFDKEQLLKSSDKVTLIECISDRDKEIDLMSVISDIDKFNFYPDYANDYNYARYGQIERKLNFEFMKKLMNQLLQKYKFGVYPDATQKATLGKFLKKFIVANYVFEENHKEVSNFFKELMAKVPLEKSKEVTKEIIKICSNVRENSQRAAILKYVLDASQNSLKGLELLEVLEQHNYARGFMLYDEDENQKGIAPIELDKDLIEELISDIIKKPSPLTKKEVQRLEWFCTNSKPDKSIFSDNQLDLFLQLIQKMPEGSMSLDMCLNLITKFFPTLSTEIEYRTGFGREKHTCTALNLSNLESNKNDIIKNLAYALPQNKLAEIVGLWQISPGNNFWPFYNWENYDYKDENGNRYRWSTNTHNLDDPERKQYVIRYQENAKKEQEDRKKQEEAEKEEAKEEAEKEEAKKEGTQKMIPYLNKLYKNKINKTILTEFKQMYESAKERKEKNNNNMIITNEINWGENINEKINENEPDTNNQKDENQKNSQVINVSNITNTNINNNNIINNPEENQPHESSNPYTLVAWFGLLLPVISSIIFGIKIYHKQHKLTGKDIALIIVGLIPVISAIVFGIMAYRYNQNNLAKKTQENLKYAVNLNDNDIEENENEINQNEKINQLSIADGEQNQNQKIENNL